MSDTRTPCPAYAVGSACPPPPACTSAHPKTDAVTKSVAELDIPSADSIINKPADEFQTKKIIDAVNTLSVDNPSITFELSHPLARSLYQQLALKGYSVTCYSKWDCINSQNTESHKVTISLPVSTFGSWPITSSWSKLRSFTPFRF